MGVESFATRAQAMLVDHLRAENGNEIADCCKSFSSDARGRMCLAHSRYAGCNNNMGIEVSWRDIKKLLTVNCILSQFLGALCHYIRTNLGEEHMQRLMDMGGQWQCIHPHSYPDQGNVGWRSVSAYQDAVLQLRD
jgi:hypothetical protein